MREMAARLPGASIAREVYQGVEQIALNELKQRLEALDSKPVSPPDTSATGLSRQVHPRELLSALLLESTEQDADEARRSLFTSMLLQMTPDEACMLAALSDGSEFALIDIATGNALTGQHIVARNFCSIERGAAVKLREYVPAYITHLRAMGLVDIGPEQPTLEMKYQILEGHPEVQRLIKPLKKKNRSVKMIRRSLKLSSLGAQLWRFCDPADSKHR